MAKYDRNRREDQENPEKDERTPDNTGSAQTVKPSSAGGGTGSGSTAGQTDSPSAEGTAEGQ